ncbi:hypothetical protein Syun_020476 [Stephania yunnanensis]|uniref:FKBP12-interacting protein of 37 kDa n=1 Tax=Stephania yunnanensis TaxID=152371 RepID=A0AAP0NPP4_9MAGN
MASNPHIDDDDEFGGDVTGSNPRRRGTKRSFGELEEEDEDLFGSKKGKSKVEESAPGAAAGMILSLRDNLRECRDALGSNQNELEAAKSEISRWYSAFQPEPSFPAVSSPEPSLVINYLHTLKSSEESLKEQLEKAKKKEAAFIVTFAKREQEVAELKSTLRDLRAQLKPPSLQARKLLLDPAIHEEFTRLKNLIEEKEKKVRELDNDAGANYTPQSKMGKMLMAKCRTLQEENEEIGTLASEGKMHELIMKLALQKSQYAELRKQFEGLHDHVGDLTNEVEKANEMVHTLQQKLEERNSEIKRARDELHQKDLQKKGEADADSNEKIDVDSIEAEG